MPLAVGWGRHSGSPKALRSSPRQFSSGMRPDSGTRVACHAVDENRI
ncbi:MAG: hypothetical protein PVG06_11510 [Desulfobacterales bacterium]